MTIQLYCQQCTRMASRSPTRSHAPPRRRRAAVATARSRDADPTTRARDADLTAAARIRDAALRRFAAAGVRGTSIRDVAREAGVSAGLVQHHYHSKQGLRRAVDEHVVQRATAAFAVPTAGARPDESALRVGRRISAFVRENPDAFAYIGRSLVDSDAPGT